MNIQRVDAVGTLHRTAYILLLAVVTEVDFGVDGHILHSGTETRNLEVFCLLGCGRDSPTSCVVEGGVTSSHRPRTAV